MFRAFLAVALFGLLLTINPTFAFAAPMDEAGFKQMLAKGSPWSVKWEHANSPFTKGTHKLRFKKDGNVLSGEFFGSDRGSADLPLKDVAIKTENNKMCVKFVAGQSPRKYNYCLEKDGTLKGDYEGQSRSGNLYSGKAAATPTSGK